MNADLKLRLANLWELDEEEDLFLVYLVENLGKEALLGTDDGEEVLVHFEYIENGEDDCAFMTGTEDGQEFNIHLDKRMPFGMIVDYLAHELAHVHSWERADEDEDHCDEFGKSYAVLYRYYLFLYDEFWSNR